MTALLWRALILALYSGLFVRKPGKFFVNKKFVGFSIILQFFTFSGNNRRTRLNMKISLSIQGEGRKAVRMKKKKLQIFLPEPQLQ